MIVISNFSTVEILLNVVDKRVELVKVEKKLGTNYEIIKPRNKKVFTGKDIDLIAKQK